MRKTKVREDQSEPERCATLDSHETAEESDKREKEEIQDTDEGDVAGSKTTGNGSHEKTARTTKTQHALKRERGRKRIRRKRQRIILRMSSR